jgi:hypothetical protein
MTWYDCVSKIIQVGKRAPVNFNENSIYFPSQYVKKKGGWVSEWVTDGNLVILQLYHGENKLIVNVMMIISALY